MKNIIRKHDFAPFLVEIPKIKSRKIYLYNTKILVAGTTILQYTVHKCQAIFRQYSFDKNIKS